MSYLGNSTTFQTVAPGIDYFSGNASTTTFQLSRQIVAVQDILVYIDNVPQNPSTAYSINTATNQITFTSAPLSGTNNIWVYYNTKSIQFLVPSPGTVSNSSLNSGSFSNITGVGTLSSLTVTNDASISGLTVGKGGNAVSTNTAVGASALAGNQAAGNSNTAIGWYSMAQGAVTGTDNTAVGYTSLYNVTSGGYNTALGDRSLFNNTTASNNTAIGYQSAYTNSTGTNNVALGYTALLLNSTGSRNTALGSLSLYNNTGGNNTAIGAYSANANTSGVENVAVGDQALYSNTTGSYNTAIGRTALNGNTTASYNTAVGYQAGYTQSGSNAVANTFIGYQAGQVVTTGQVNTFVGFATGNTITTGSKNTIIGGYSGNQGGLDIRTASNYIVLSDGDGNPRQIINGSGYYLLNAVTAASNGAITTIKHPSSATTWGVGPYSGGAYLLYNESGVGVYLASGGTSWSSSSDETVKENLVPIADALTKVSTLRTVIGNYTKDSEKVKHPFLIAQDVQAVLPEAVNETSEGTLGLQYTDVIPLLVAAIKELKAEFDAYKATHP